MTRSARAAGPLAFALLACAQPLPGQSSDSLTTQILRADSAVFAAFNARDLERFLPFFADELEFYHDIDGLSDRSGFITSSRRLFSSESPPTRRLFRTSVEVHPIPGFGAVQIGTHEFCNTAGGQLDCGTFGFTHVWSWRRDQWQISRVLSYGH